MRHVMPIIGQTSCLSDYVNFLSLELLGFTGLIFVGMEPRCGGDHHLRLPAGRWLARSEAGRSRVGTAQVVALLSSAAGAGDRELPQQGAAVVARAGTVVVWNGRLYVLATTHRREQGNRGEKDR